MFSLEYWITVALVNSQDDPEAYRMLYHRQVELGKWTDAQNTLDSLPSEWQTWKNIQQILLDKWQSLGDTLTSTEEAYLDSLSLEHSANGALARNLLNQLKDKLFYPFAPQNLSSERTFKPIYVTQANSLMTIFPNPGSGDFTIRTGIPDVDPNGELEIIDLSGRIVWKQTGIIPVQQLDLNHLNRGIYALRILTQDGPSILKFVID